MIRKLITPGDEQPLCWIDVQSPGATEFEALHQTYDFSLEHIQDCLDPEHLPKAEPFEEGHFVILRAYQQDAPADAHTVQDLSTKIAIYTKDHLLITIHRMPLPFIEEIAKRFEQWQKAFSTRQIIVHLIHESLESYRPIVVELIKQIDEYEVRLFQEEELQPQMQRRLYFLKRKAGVLRNIVFLMQEVLSAFRSDKKHQSFYWQDTLDLAQHLQNTFRQAEEDAGSLLNFYLSLAAHQTNEVMRILTIFSVFFLPLTFIVGVYGMNFEYMPELKMHYGYFGVWGVMVLLTVVIYFIFKKKKWL
ncbi:MAG: magnesium transport protein CorA [Thermonema sp.]|uniref:CorA family divalent cation transporter n=1 Tax=Thermonema sp. TaxID=2231181 RepID=UPI0021DE9ADF|nr:CorA family divalent cation transporter [Thermonema sp.]GIV38940.1 MAG: magnesium transport protein CorA [Thermonema sp.]